MSKKSLDKSERERIEKEKEQQVARQYDIIERHQRGLQEAIRRLKQIERD
ncbi:hypothetical protein LCGC14_0972290 [marine sediment metagenome]|uniref:Uncharacterized protein n=1 Tax=marine sediment metagenome TaxID=412755 RepID=A0A0F9NFT7_9ZZZZ